MSEDKQIVKNTGLGHDDDGNVDDKRIAAWLTFAGLVYLSFHAVVNESAEALQLIEMLVWPWMVLMGTAVVDKFKPKGM